MGQVAPRAGRSASGRRWPYAIAHAYVRARRVAHTRALLRRTRACGVRLASGHGGDPPVGLLVVDGERGGPRWDHRRDGGLCRRGHGRAPHRPDLRGQGLGRALRRVPEPGVDGAHGARRVGGAPGGHGLRHDPRHRMVLRRPLDLRCGRELGRASLGASAPLRRADGEALRSGRPPSRRCIRSQRRGGGRSPGASHGRRARRLGGARRRLDAVRGVAGAERQDRQARRAGRRGLDGEPHLRPRHACAPRRLQQGLRPLRGTSPARGLPRQLRVRKRLVTRTPA